MVVDLGELDRCPGPTNSKRARLFLPNTVRVAHRNEDSDSSAAFNETLTQQGLDVLIPLLQSSDRWRHRQFGMILSGENLGRTSPSTLKSIAPGRTFALLVSTHSNQTETAAEWHMQMSQRHEHDRLRSAVCVQSHVDWWTAFWNRSHIVVTSETNEDEETLTKQYAVTRYVQAIQARTWVPVKFNGQAFTSNLPPETLTSGPTYPRDWGANSWWQNNRCT